MSNTTSISIKDTKILDFGIKKTWQHELPSDKTYNILESKSTVPKELKSATFDNFIAETPEEKQLLAFAKEHI